MSRKKRKYGSIEKEEDLPIVQLQTKDRPPRHSTWLLTEVADQINVLDIRRIVIGYTLSREQILEYLTQCVRDRCGLEEVQWTLRYFKELPSDRGAMWGHLCRVMFRHFVDLDVRVVDAIFGIESEDWRHEWLKNNPVQDPFTLLSEARYEHYEWLMTYQSDWYDAESSVFQVLEHRERVPILTYLIESGFMTLKEMEKQTGGKKTFLESLVGSSLHPRFLERLCDPNDCFRYTRVDLRPCLARLLRIREHDEERLELFQWLLTPVPEGPGLSIDDLTDCIRRSHRKLSYTDRPRPLPLQIRSLRYLVSQGMSAKLFLESVTQRVRDTSEFDYKDIRNVFDPREIPHFEDPADPLRQKVLRGFIKGRGPTREELEYYCGDIFRVTADELRSIGLLKHLAKIELQSADEAVRFLCNPAGPTRFTLEDVLAGDEESPFAVASRTSRRYFCEQFNITVHKDGCLSYPIPSE